MILVTGGTGLIGSQLLLDLTADGKRVRGLKRISSTMHVINLVFRDHKDLLHQIDWVDGDVTDLCSLENAFDGVREVYHCAALVSFHPSDREHLLKINTEGTANMVNLALAFEIEKFCYVSSTAALGKIRNDLLITENSSWKKSKHNSVYGISKYGAEREVWRGMEEGLQAVIVNPSIVIGPGDLTSGSMALFGEVKKGLKFYPVGSTGFVDVRDVTKCMMALMEKSIFSQRFIISSENIAYREVLNKVADCFGMARPTLRAGKILNEIGWRVEAARKIFSRSKPMITKETARNGQQHWRYSNEKIKIATGIEFIPINKAIEETCRVFKEGRLVTSTVDVAYLKVPAH